VPVGAHQPFIELVTGFVGQFPDLSVDIKRVVAERDLLVTHSLIKTSPRIGAPRRRTSSGENGKIVEHWDVLQPVPETAANDNTMF
jgi:predicted SnoaL-like aldol condensation-catalyzing enzyme